MRRALLALTVLSLVLVPYRAAGAPGDLHLASITADGVKGEWSTQPSLSGDGTRVAFSSGSQLHPDDDDAETDAYVKDLTTSEIWLASTSASGEKGNARSSHAAISADGNRVAFLSGATNLHPSGATGLMVKDLTTGEVFLVAPGGEYPALSIDGTRVAFSTISTGLDPRDDDETADIYVRDLVSGELFLASTSSEGIKANGDFFHGSVGAALSGDGIMVAFASGATNLHPGDGDDIFDAYVKNLETGELRLISTAPDGVKGDGNSFSPSLSADGSIAAFRSYSSNLVPGFSGGFGQIFVKDLATGDVRPASLSASGERADRGAADPSLSADGTRVAFSSGATNLHPADADVVSDIFVKDLSTGGVELASTSSSGIKGNGTSYQVSLGDRGAAVAFRSDATNLDPADGESGPDVYVKELGGPEPPSEATGDLSISQAASPDPVPAGEPITYDVRVRNAGPAEATGVAMLDELPDGVTFDSATASQGGGCSESGGIVRCDLGSLAPGQTADASVVVVPQDLGYLTNTVTVQANEPDPNTLDNRSSINTDVDPAADVAVSLTDSPDPVRVRQPLTYTISIENRGPTWATLELVDTLPSGVRVEAVDAGGSSCTVSRDEIVCRIFGVPDGGSATVRIVVSARKPAALANRATAVPLHFDPDPANNSAEETTVVVR
ncbi:MAG TPA: hypothetical protein VF058_05580 [Actinomycetota bacterium]